MTPYCKHGKSYHGACSECDDEWRDTDAFKRMAQTIARLGEAGDEAHKAYEAASARAEAAAKDDAMHQQVWQGMFNMAIDRAERAESERDAALADARRYRWLRDEGIEWLPPKYDGRDYGRFDMFYKWPDANLDAAIDSALAAQAGAQP